MDALFAVAIGLGAGILSGLLGIGGGTVMVPALIFLLALPQRTAQGVSLLVIIPTALVGAFTHYRLKQVQLRWVMWMVPAAIVGTFGGSLIANNLPEDILQRAFAVILAYVSIRMLLPARKKAPKRAEVGEA